MSIEMIIRVHAGQVKQSAYGSHHYELLNLKPLRRAKFQAVNTGISAEPVC
jgi:hypothetical protein